MAANCSVGFSAAGFGIGLGAETLATGFGAAGF
jgi:hypothetical protein